MEKKTPMRMCIACREMKPKKEMARIVKSGEDIRLDLTGKANGRGAYICNDGQCIKKLKKYRLLSKAFSCAVSEEVYTDIEENFFGEQK